MQAFGGEGHQHQQYAQGNATAGEEIMSRNATLNGGHAAPGIRASEMTSQSDGGNSNAGNSNAATGGHKLKLRLGGSSLSSNRGASVSSEGTNGPATPRAGTPVAASRATTPVQVSHTNGHTAADQHGQVNGEAVMSDVPETGIKQEQASTLPTGGKGALEGRMSLPDGQAGAVEDEQSKQQRDQQLKKDLAELPYVAHQSLVPLYELVRRLVARSYTDLQSIVEVLPSQSDFDRKRTIIEYVITTRRQIVKLLVLLRWAKENTRDTERSMNLITFLQRQNYQLERAVQALQGVEGMLAGARVRNYDLMTAVEVLTTGTYAQLPTLFKDSFIPPPKLTNKAVVTLLHDLEQVIRLRLQLYERIPVQLLRRPYRIHDGRVTFHCPSYFKAAYTLGGGSATDQWYLVDFSFDFQGRDVQRHPTGAMREHILQVCNARLSECAAKEKGDQGERTNSSLLHEQKGAAFIQTFSVLQDLCLNYQLELLHYHALQTNNSPTIWQGMLGIELSNDRKTLEIRNKALSKGPLPTSHHGPELRYEEKFTITVADQETQSVKSVTNRLTRLAESFADIVPATALPSDSNVRKSSTQTLIPTNRALSCTFSREAMFIDPKGKKVPPPVQRKVNMRKVEYPVSFVESTSGTQSIRDIELVLGQCFSIKASMIPPNPS